MGRSQPQACLTPNPMLTIGSMPSVIYRSTVRGRVRSKWELGSCLYVLFSGRREHTWGMFTHLPGGPSSPSQPLFFGKHYRRTRQWLLPFPLDSSHVQKEGEQVKWGYMAFYNRTPNLLLLEHLKDSVFYFRKGQPKKGEEVKHWNEESVYRGNGFFHLTSSGAAHIYGSWYQRIPHKTSCSWGHWTFSNSGWI